MAYVKRFTGEQVGGVQRRVTEYTQAVQLSGLCGPALATHLTDLGVANSSHGLYFFAALLGLVAGLLPASVTVGINDERKVPASTFVVLVGPPSSGKTSAMRVALTDPLTALDIHEHERSNTIFTSGSKEGLLACVAKKPGKHALICHDEIYGYLVRVINNTQGELDLLNSVWSGSAINEKFKNRPGLTITRANISLCGAIQTERMMELLFACNTATGFLDRVLFLCSTGLLPTEDEEAAAGRVQAARAATYNTLEQCARLIRRQHPHDRAGGTHYTLTDQARVHLGTRQLAERREYNDKIMAGEPVKSSKGSELIMRVALLLHVMQHTLLTANLHIDIPRRIPQPTLQQAIAVTEFAAGVFDIVDSCVEELRPLLQKVVVKAAEGEKASPKDILKSPGKYVWPSHLKRSVRHFRAMSTSEIKMMMAGLADFGRLDANNVFVKKAPAEIDVNIFDGVNITVDEYQHAYNLECHRSVVTKLQRLGGYQM